MAPKRADNRAVSCNGVFVPLAQSIERTRPKRQVVGESPAGDTIFAGMVQQQNAAVPRPRRRCDSVHPLHFCPCGVVQTTCLPLMQEITGAKPVRDANFTAPKAFGAMEFLGMEARWAQLRLGAPVWWRSGG